VNHTNENISTVRHSVILLLFGLNATVPVSFKWRTYWLLSGCWSSVRYFVYRLPLLDLNKQ